MEPWTAYNNGSGLRIWFVARREAQRWSDYHTSKNGTLIRYGSMKAAQKQATALNKDESHDGA